MDSSDSSSRLSATNPPRRLRARGTVASLALGAALAIAATAAHADLGNLSVVINSGVTGNTVSYSQPAAGKQSALPVWAAFTVDVSNPSPNNVSNAWITFTNTQGTPFKVPPAINASGDASGTCALGAVAATPAVICKVSLAGSGAGSLNFTLRALSPEAQNAQPPVNEIAINWSVQTGQGAAGANPSQVTNRGAGLVNLAAGSPTDLRGYIDPDIALAVQDAGGSSTKVSNTPAVTAAVKQEVAVSSCSPQYKVCLQSTLSVPGTFTPPMFVDLFRAKSTLKGGAKIANLSLFYSDPAAAVPLLPIIQCDLAPGADPANIANWSIPPIIPSSLAQGRCFIPASPANPFTYSDDTGWHIRLLESTNGIINW